MHFSYIQLGAMGRNPPGLFVHVLSFLSCLTFQHDLFRCNAKEYSFLHWILNGMLHCLAKLSNGNHRIYWFFDYLIVKKNSQKETKKTLTIVLISFFLIFLVWLNPVARFRVIEEPRITIYHADRTVTNWNSVSYRLLEWEGSWSVIRSNWLAGVGTGGWKIALDNFYAHYNSSTVGLEHNAHNQYLQTWMENGILGLIRFLCMFMDRPFSIACRPKLYIVYSYL